MSLIWRNWITFLTHGINAYPTQRRRQGDHGKRITKHLLERGPGKWKGLESLSPAPYGGDHQMTSATSKAGSDELELLTFAIRKQNEFFAKLKPHYRNQHICHVPPAHGEAQNTHGKGLRRAWPTANPRRQSPLHRGPSVGHTTNIFVVCHHGHTTKIAFWRRQPTASTPVDGLQLVTSLCARQMAHGEVIGLAMF